MPRGDGTGPMGMGPMTGRGAGYCAGFAVPGYANPAWGCGMGFGRGRGFRRAFSGMPGRAWGGYGYPRNQAMGVPETDERDALMGQVEFLENQIKNLRGRLKELDDKG